MPVAFREELEPLRPYVPPKSWRMAAEGTDDSYAKLTSNELAFGPLPEAEAALSEVLPRANRYPDSHVSRLREVIAGANAGAETRNVLVGNGSSEVLLNALQLLPAGGEIVYPWPSFSLYPMLDVVRDLAAALPHHVLLILDEAYVEFVDDPAYGDSHTLALETENVVVARTFSKAHGLAGLRCGYGIAPARIADYAERVRFPVSVNLAAQVAATASMLAEEKVRARAEFVVRERARLQEAFVEAGLATIPSQGNFVMVKFGADEFEKSGILVREGGALGYSGWSRVTVGNAEENDRVVEAVRARAAVGGA